MTEPAMVAVTAAAKAMPPSPWWRWWKELQERKGDRAELRRCGSIIDVAFTPMYHRLLHQLGSRLPEADRDRVAAVAAILAHVDSASDEVSMGEAMARPHNGKARVSDARFRRLLRIDRIEELRSELIRITRLLDRRIPIDSLARDLVKWSDAVKKRWALDYYELTQDK